MHDDHHAMWINPNNPNHIIEGTDGGVGISYDRARTFEGIYNMDLGQFYHVTYDMETPYHVYGGLRTTTRGADRARCAAGRASRTTTGSRCRAATASTSRSIRRIRGRSMPNRRTATFRASIA